MKKYYPAIFTPDDNGFYLVDFPDLPGCYTDGQDIEDATEMAEDVLNLTLYSMEKDGEEIPSPSDPREIAIPPNGFISMLHADTIAYAKKINPKSVNKTVTLPGWLDSLAQKANLNFSQTLQEALAQKLNIPLT